MSVRALALLRVSLTVGDLDRLAAFYITALGFTPAGPPVEADPAMARLLGARRMRTVQLRRGHQVLELAQFDPPAAAYPAGGRSNDAWFQHAALVTDDIATSYARLSGTPHEPISRGGPQSLPGGMAAYKFRDSEEHPLELIQFPSPNPATAGGIDHSAIVVADAERSIGFYTAMLGLGVVARQVNTGPAQDALDGLDGTIVDVVALSPAQPAPHVELLGYRNPKGRKRPAGVAHSRLVFQVDSLENYPSAITLQNGSRLMLIQDPDGHASLLIE